jgi:hypothetical protein
MAILEDLQEVVTLLGRNRNVEMVEMGCQVEMGSGQAK